VRESDGGVTHIGDGGVTYMGDGRVTYIGDGNMKKRCRTMLYTSNRYAHFLYSLPNKKYVIKHILKYIVSSTQLELINETDLRQKLWGYFVKINQYCE